MRWEYFVHTINAGGTFRQGNIDPREMQDALNHYGQYGWELVNAFDTNSGHGGTWLVVLTFKRPVESIAPPPVPGR